MRGTPFPPVCAFPTTCAIPRVHPPLPIDKATDLGHSVLRLGQPGKEVPTVDHVGSHGQFYRCARGVRAARRRGRWPPEAGSPRCPRAPAAGAVRTDRRAAARPTDVGRPDPPRGTRLRRTEIGQRHHRIAGQLRLLCRLGHPKVHPGGDQRTTGRDRRSGVSERDKCSQRQTATGRVPRHCHCFWAHPAGSGRPPVGIEGVVQRGRKGMLGCQPVLDQKNRSPERHRQATGEAAVAPDRPAAVTAPVQVEDHPVAASSRGHQQNGRNSARIHGGGGDALGYRVHGTEYIKLVPASDQDRARTGHGRGIGPRGSPRWRGTPQWARDRPLAPTIGHGENRRGAKPTGRG